MTQEEKSLLLKDLCARLPYGVKCYPVTTNGKPNIIGGYCEIFDDFYIGEISGWFNISMIKPYLRPMSSMTEEEAMEYANCGNIIANSPQNNYLIPNPNCVDWLNAHHFDYRGLIEKGLALEAPKGMYEY